MSQPLIEFVDVHKRFGNHVILDGANLSIFRGEITTIIGKSGMGKSVLLKHIIGLLDPDAGQIRFEGKAFKRMSSAERRNLRRRFSYMFQGTALFDSMTVTENIALPLRETTELPADQIAVRVTEKIDQLDLRGIEHKYPAQISGGMKKRVALARALITDPQIVLFDEPTTGLDPIRKNAVHSMISDYQKKFGYTGIVVSHEIPDVFYISQRVAMLDNGKILFQGTPEEAQKSADPVVHDFIRGLENRHDGLTGLAPQPEGEKRFAEELARLKRHELAFSLMLLTIENFDEILGTIGHVAGQTVIQDLSAQVQRHLRITDTCVRFGLKQIMVILPNTTVEQARLACDKLARSLQGQDIMAIQPHPGFCFSVSAGFAEAKKDSRLEDLLNQAESRQNTFYEFNVC